MASQPATLLIVDDEIQVRKLLETLLRHEGYQTVSAASGEEALQLVAQRPPDLILLDIMMPGMDGYEVANQLKGNQATANIPIIMLSALSESSARLSGLETGAEEFISKPVERVELWLRVRNLLRLKAHGDRLKNHSQLLEQQLQHHQNESSRLNVHDLARLDLEKALRLAVEREEFVLHYQPKVELANGQVCALEALLRWDRPGYGAVSPAVFIPILESQGLIVTLGRWVIDNVCRQIAAWQSGTVGAVEVSVNVSGHQLIEGDLIADIAQSLAQAGVEAHWLEVELTEGSLMENTQHTIASLQRLRAMGVKISIDDFGTGYSSLAYLRRFPIDTLKIDIAFIREVTSNPQDAAITRTIIELAHSLKLRVVAEGVETQAQLEFLREAGCDQIQGYLFSRPLPMKELERLLLDKRSLVRPQPH
ncbi:MULTISPECIES: EAL domain-containing response regulator [Pseudomonas]|jgi:EAL domain-containing protein (putative c-di-GMP-specific phosphodiesterase class I)/FixJ family two-component response regulator|uniref:EAL domain-containing response regulator n=1 Tax=Pseudomonas TaxID=286 RepID=UPI000272BFC2|nr:MULTISPECIES: EAL domain-containing response regulator [Pseudomonas]MDP9062652.1 EAL domain-containing response regulator [Pseudomonadota bacterium]AUO23504.1 cyclic di-GMP phosphodiesterase [Pseudomonas sp. NC02]EJF73955.1 putative sensory box GGDEF/EAL domain-containing protein [Pseudomonas sp. Ag1]MBT1265416.1 EAL domain-containing response regulator [Pseudomonas sp. VS38]MDE1913578.1 EAL domain-containing response regulator [Pseudomonas sp.]